MLTRPDGDSSNSPASQKKPPKKHLLNLTLAGMPELNYFETEEERQRALQEIGQEAAKLTSVAFWLSILILVVSALAARFIAGWLLSYVDWHHELEDALRVLAIVATGFVVLRALHRAGSAGELRQKLIAAGVPVCAKCGYLLRGLPLGPGRCPECGRPFDAQVRAILEKAGTPPRG